MTRTAIETKKVDIQIGSLIRKYRKKSDMTQIDLAEKLGYKTPQFISLFERGSSKVPIRILGMLVIILKIPEEKILKIIISFRSRGIIREITEGKKSIKEELLVY